MSTKSREHLFGMTIRLSAERAKAARKEADRLACEAWNFRMLGYKGPAQPSPALGDELNAGYGYLEVRCLGCDTHSTIALIRRPKATPIHEWSVARCARTARRFASISAVIWSRCDQRRSPLKMVAWRTTTNYVPDDVDPDLQPFTRAFVRVMFARAAFERIPLLRGRRNVLAQGTL